MVAVALLALYLHRPPALVGLVYEAGGTDAVALVECESKFNPQAFRIEPRGHSSWGLFQIDNEWHLQWRFNLGKHIEEGARILAEAPGDELYIKVAHYNGGTYPPAKSWAWGKKVQALRDDMAHWLWLALR